jgi:mannitol-specific phosphotransferase system IIBC component
MVDGKKRIGARTVEKKEVLFFKIRRMHGPRLGILLCFLIRYFHAQMAHRR